MRKNYFLICLIICACLSIQYLSAQTGWFALSSGTTESLLRVKFVNQNTGWVVSSQGSIFKTTNGGTNWLLQLNLVNSIFISIYFLDENTGWTSGGSSNNGLILKTTNGGTNWITQPCGISDALTSIQFINQNTGWAVSQWGYILKTTNSGTNWIIQTNNFPFYLFGAVYFLDPNTGWVGGGNGIDSGIIRKTTNGGTSWVNQTTGSYSLFDGICFTDPSNGYAVGQGGVIRKTTNSGSNWIWIVSGINSDFHSIQFINGNTGWISINGGIVLKSINAGLNWYSQNTPSSANLYSIFFIDQNTGWVVGYSGVILKTTNGGDPIGIKPISSEIPSHFSLYQNYPNPFNPSTKIKFSIPASLVPSKGGSQVVRLVIYDILGREIASLLPAYGSQAGIPPPGGAQEGLSPGTYEVEWNANGYPSGVYFYKLSSTEYTETKKMILIK